MANPFIHIELNTTDVAKAREFYKQLFAWKLSSLKLPDLDYTLIDPQGGTGGGMMKQMMPDTPSFWLSYMLVDDAAAYTKQARELGATVLKDVTEVPNIGWLSILKDPTGAVFGLWQQRPMGEPV